MGAPGLAARGPRRQVFVDGVVKTWETTNLRAFAADRERKYEILFA